MKDNATESKGVKNMGKKSTFTYKDPKELIAYKNNSRTHSENQIKRIETSILEFGFLNPVIIESNGVIVAGHARVTSAINLGMEEVPCLMAEHLTPQQVQAYVIADNRLAELSDWDADVLGVEMEALKMEDFDLTILGFDEEFKAAPTANFDKYSGDAESAGNMARDFGMPPFSVLDTRKKEWTDRKAVWKRIINDNGESREGTLSGTGALSSINNGVSILDPVMAELLVYWFGNKGGVAFDPFAGDTVFGFVAGKLGMEFKGIELREEQAALNNARTKEAGLPCTYYNDTSENMDRYIGDGEVDLVFSCPPYADLEIYSDNPKDLSNMSHDEFFNVYRRILMNTYKKLKDDRFAVIVMGEVRGKDGGYIGTIPNTIKIMEEAGYTYYNEMILVNSVGTLPMRAGAVMRASRKIGKMHQNILVFLKGDAKKAVASLGEIATVDVQSAEGLEPDEHTLDVIDQEVIDANL